MRPDKLNVGWVHDDTPPAAMRAHRHPGDLERRVMDHLQASNRPLGAYEIARLSRRSGSPLAPNQVYRVLARLAARGDVQRIELLSAYLPTRRECAGFLVCRHCRSVETFDSTAVAQRIDLLCRSEGFAASAAIVELLGLCADCPAPTANNGSPKRSSGMRMLLALLSLAGSVAPIAPADAVTASRPNPSGNPGIVGGMAAADRASPLPCERSAIFPLRTPELHLPHRKERN